MSLRIFLCHCLPPPLTVSSSLFLSLLLVTTAVGEVFFSLFRVEFEWITTQIVGEQQTTNNLSVHFPQRTCYKRKPHFCDEHDEHLQTSENKPSALMSSAAELIAEVPQNEFIHHNLCVWFGETCLIELESWSLGLMFCNSGEQFLITLQAYSNSDCISYYTGILETDLLI